MEGALRPRRTSARSGHSAPAVAAILAPRRLKTFLATRQRRFMAIPRLISWAAALAALAASPALVAAQTLDNPIISRREAARLGLERAWYTQVQLDRARGYIVDVFDAGDTLFAVTNSGMVQSIDAETGQTQWIMQVGPPEHPSLAPAANDEYVAVVNGSRLHVLDRQTGRPLWDRPLGDAPGAGPALTADRAFVPMMSGRIEAYLLEPERKSQPPWAYYSHGRAVIQPVATPDSVFWATDMGYLYSARITEQGDKPTIRFRVEMHDEIVCSPAYAKPYIYTVSLDGYVYAVHEVSGERRWRFSAGDPISREPVAVGHRLYVCPDEAGMYCLNSDDGQVVWTSPGAAHFVSASKDHVYATDEMGRLLVLSAQSGARLGALPLAPRTRTLVNAKTDRIYLVGRRGLIQCLHDAAQVKPLVHQQVLAQEQKKKKASTVKQKGLEEAAKEQPKPAEKAPAEGGGANPFGGVGDNPFGGGETPQPPQKENGGGDNPFGGNPFGGGQEQPKQDGGAANPFGASPFGGDNPFQ